MRIDNEIKLDYKDVLFRPKRSELQSRKQVDLSRKFVFRNSQMTYDGIPVMNANMDTIGTFDMVTKLSSMNLVSTLHKHYSVEELIEFFQQHNQKVEVGPVFYSMGIVDRDFEKLEEVSKEVNIYYICLDVANGYSEKFVDAVSKLRRLYPQSTIMAGNVVTGEMTEELILAGADIIKIGIGSGSVCTTRKVAGVGYPQLSAVIECADSAHGLGALVCADGGCTMPADVAKAFGAGADFVMLGGMLSGHEECAGDVENIDGKPMKVFYGMSSEAAMNKHSGGVASYRASEGKEVYIPYRGPVENTILTILGGVRSTCTYVGAATLKELSKRTTFIRVTETHNRVFGD